MIKHQHLTGILPSDTTTTKTPPTLSWWSFIWHLTNNKPHSSPKVLRDFIDIAVIFYPCFRDITISNLKCKPPPFLLKILLTFFQVKLLSRQGTELEQGTILTEWYKDQHVSKFTSFGQYFVTMPRSCLPCIKCCSVCWLIGRQHISILIILVVIYVYSWLLLDWYTSNTWQIFTDT